MKEIISNLAAILWFVFVLVWCVIALPFYLVFPISNITKIIELGFVTSTTSGFASLIVFGLIFGVTMLVPVLRKCYKKLPWLYPYTVILCFDLVIFSVAEEILNYAYQVRNDTRHSIFIIIMVIQLIVCRIAMCIYMKKKPLKIARDEYEQY